MTDRPAKDGRSSTSALYSSFRRKLKGNRTQTAESFESEASVATTATTASEDTVHTEETPLTSVESVAETKEEADGSERAVAIVTLEQSPGSPESMGDAPSPNPELDGLPQERRSKRRMVYTAIKSGVRMSRSLTSSLLTDDKATTTPAATSADETSATAVANTDEDLPITDSPPPVEASLSNLSLEESANETSTSIEDAGSAAEPGQEPLSKRRTLYNALKGKMSSSRSQTLDSVTEAGPDATPAAAGDDGAVTEAAASLEIQLPSTSIDPPAVATPENEPKKIKFAITPQERNEIEIRSLPEITEMLANVKDHDVTNDVECSFERENIFATGGYGDIYIGAFKNQQENGEATEVKVAVKRFRTHIKDDSEKPFVRSFCRETKIWAKLTHTNILTFRGYFIDGPNACLVSDFMENGSSLDYIKSHPEADLEAFLKGSAEALKFCHDKGIIHSDVKSNNILVSPSGQPLLCDFGISFMILSSQTLTSTTGGIKGSLRWMSPELLQSTTKHTAESDVWAFGMTIFEFLAKEAPYANVYSEVQIFRTIIKGVKPIPTSIVPEVQASTSIWDSLSDGAKELLSPDVPPFMEPNEIRLWNLCKKCWEKDPKARIPMFSVIDYLDRRYAEKSNMLDTGKKPFDSAEYVMSIRDVDVVSDYALEEKIKKKRRDMKMKAAGLAGLAPTLITGIPGAMGTAVTARRIQISRQKLALLEREWVRRGKTPIP